MDVALHVPFGAHHEQAVPERRDEFTDLLDGQRGLLHQELGAVPELLVLEVFLRVARDVRRGGQRVAAQAGEQALHDVQVPLTAGVHHARLLQHGQLFGRVVQGGLTGDQGVLEDHVGRVALRAVREATRDAQDGALDGFHDGPVPGLLCGLQRRHELRSPTAHREAETAKAHRG